MNWWEPLLLVPVIFMAIRMDFSYQKALSRAEAFETSDDKRRLTRELLGESAESWER